MAEVSLHRVFIILSVFTWFAYVINGEGQRQVNCEVYVYHPNCRGMQAKKRFMNSLENDKTDPACPCRNFKKWNGNDIDSMTSSKLLEALFAKGFDAKTIWDAYAATTDRRRDYSLGGSDASNRRSRQSTRDDFMEPMSNSEYNNQDY